MPYEVVSKGSGCVVRNKVTGKEYEGSPIPCARARAQERAIGLHTHLGGGEIEGGYRAGSANKDNRGKKKSAGKKKKRSTSMPYSPKKRKLTKYQLFLKRFAKDMRESGHKVHNFMEEASVAWALNK